MRSFEVHQDRIQGVLDKHYKSMQESVDAALEREMQEFASRLGAFLNVLAHDYKEIDNDNIRTD